MAIASPVLRVDKVADYLGAEAGLPLEPQIPRPFPRRTWRCRVRTSAERVWMDSDRNPQVIRSLQQIYDNGRLAGTGYVSILPVDQGIEHSAGASFAPKPGLLRSGADC